MFYKDNSPLPGIDISRGGGYGASCNKEKGKSKSRTAKQGH